MPMAAEPVRAGHTRELTRPQHPPLPHRCQVLPKARQELPLPFHRGAVGHRGADVKDTVAEMAAKAHEISLEAGSKMAAAMKDVVGGSWTDRTRARKRARSAPVHGPPRSDDPGRGRQADARSRSCDAQAARSASRRFQPHRGSQACRRGASGENFGSAPRSPGGEDPTFQTACESRCRETSCQESSDRKGRQRRRQRRENAKDQGTAAAKELQRSQSRKN